MTIIRSRVQCFRCKKSVDKSDTLVIKTITKDPRYECSQCYKRNRTKPWGFGDEMSYKKDYYCERCRYKFSSKKDVCPYCSKSDQIEGGNITVKDLI